MTNGEKYKTPKERAKAFYKALDEIDGVNADNYLEKAYAWLDAEAEAADPLPCPFCGGMVQIIHDTQAVAEKARWLVNCYRCPYESGAATKEEVVAAHNRVARAVSAAEGGAE